MTHDLKLFAQWTANPAPAPQPSGDGDSDEGASGSAPLSETGSPVFVAVGASMAAGLLAVGLLLSRRRH